MTSTTPPRTRPENPGVEAPGDDPRREPVDKIAPPLPASGGLPKLQSIPIASRMSRRSMRRKSVRLSPSRRRTVNSCRRGTSREAEASIRRGDAASSLGQEDISLLSVPGCF